MAAKMKEIKISINKKLTNWNDIEPYFKKMMNVGINSISDMEQLILNSGDVAAFIGEKFARAYIDMTCHTNIKKRRLEIFCNIDKIIMNKPYKWYIF